MFKVNKKYRSKESLEVKPFHVVLAWDTDEEDANGSTIHQVEAIRLANFDAYQALRAAYDHFGVDESKVWFHSVVDLTYFKDEEEEELVVENGPMILELPCE